MMKTKSKIFGLRYLERTRNDPVLSGGNLGPSNGIDVGTLHQDGTEDTKHYTDAESQRVIYVDIA